MAKIRYYYDTETCKYERVKAKKSDIILNALGILSLTVAIAVGMVVLFVNYFESPKERMQRNKLSEQEFVIEDLSHEVDRMNKVLTDVENRDDNIYRKILGAEPIDKDVREAGVGGYDRYKNLKDMDLLREDLVIALREKVDKLKRKVYIESKSQDDIIKLAEDKEKLFAAIPAIQPISNKQLLALASGFGWRIHPIYKVKKMHTGIDFAASIGTPIYATADGKVTAIDVKFSGYGKSVEIDHGFGYKTRYAHMHEFAVHPGQVLKRGDLVGYVGNTGLSTAPHLHYEVLINGNQVDPVHYFYNDISPAEYEKILELASIENQSLGM